MVDPQSKLTVIFFNGTTYTDYSDSAADYLRDEFTLSLDSVDDYLYIGFSKPFNATFAALTTPNVNANSLAAQYFDGTTWQNLSLSDDTKGMVRSGFIGWDKTNMIATTINGVNKFYIRIRPSVTHSATVYRGLNILFADDNALKQEFFEADNANLLPAGETSQLVNHVAARNSIIQMLRNKGIEKQGSGSSALKNLNAFDLHSLEQMRQSATMLCLSKIFFMLSDSKEDTWWAKYEEYQDKFEESFQLLLLSLDTNDDGKETVDEQNEPFKVQRWLR